MIEIYGAAHQMHSGGLLDYDGLVTQQDVCDLLKEPLTWSSIGLDKGECSWVIIINGVSYGCNTNEKLQEILTEYGMGN